jgi:hypothetical protein
MQIVAYTQTYRCKNADRQQEIDECLRRNLNHPGISKLALFNESDAPPLPEATVELEVVEGNTRISYVEWFRWVKRQGRGIALLLNADIYLDEGLEDLAATFDTPESFLALTRYNPGHAGFHLNDYPIGPRSCGVCGPMRSCQRSCSMPAAFHWAFRAATTTSPMAQTACNYKPAPPALTTKPTTGSTAG